MVNYRPIEFTDIDFIYSLRNSEDVRKVSASSGEIPYRVHVVWFDRFLTSPKSKGWIIEENGIPYGYVLLECSIAPLSTAHIDAARVSIIIVPDFRGNGYASKALQFISTTASEWGILKLTATVKVTNISSLRLFVNEGFKPVRYDPMISALTLHKKVAEE